MSKRAPAQKAAEKAYRERHESVLVRLSPEEAAAIDRAKGDKTSRAQYLKVKGLAAARRSR